MLKHDTHLDEPDEPFYPEIMLRPVPFPLPPGFLHQLGYDRAVADFGPLHAGDACEPRRFVALYWDSEANQLGWSDGRRGGVGQLDGQAWLAWLHGGGFLDLVGAWLAEHEVRLDSTSSVSPYIGYWLLVDGAENRAWVGTCGLVRKILRRQQLEPTEAELAELDEIANHPSLSHFYL